MNIKSNYMIAVRVRHKSHYRFQIKAGANPSKETRLKS